MTSTMSSSFLDLPAELRLCVYEYFLPPIMDVDNFEDLLAAQGLRATSARIRKELDEELHRRIELAIKFSMGSQNFKFITIHKGSKPKMKIAVPVSFMKAEYRPDWDPRNSFSCRLMKAIPPYVQACYSKLVHDNEVTPSEASKYAGRIMGAQLLYAMDDPGLTVQRSFWMLN